LTRSATSAFPEIRQVFSGYLHEDVFADAGTPEDALRTYWSDASPRERRRFQREARRLLEHVSTLDLDAMRDLVHQLGSRWVPPSREALVRLLTAASSFDDSSRA
jgi:hypothetical protein